MLVKVYSLCGVIDEVVGHLRYVDEPVLMDSYVDESAEVSDIGYYSWQFHAFGKIFYRVNMLVEMELLHHSTWVTTRFFEFLHDVGKSGNARLSGHIFSNINRFLFFLVAYKLGNTTSVVLCHCFYDMIALRMDGSIVERITCSGNSQEARTLLISCRTKTWYFLQLRT